MLLGLAYRLLGSRHDAEDVLQEAYLRWLGVDRATVAEPRRYLSRVVTRLALDRLRARQATRETYVGPWLPEPVPTEPSPFGPLEPRGAARLAVRRPAARAGAAHPTGARGVRPAHRVRAALRRDRAKSWTGVPRTAASSTTARPPAYARSSAASPPAVPNGNGCWTRSSPQPATVTWRPSPAWSLPTPPPGTTAAVGCAPPATRSPARTGSPGSSPGSTAADRRWTMRRVELNGEPAALLTRDGRQPVHPDRQRGGRPDHRRLRGGQPGEAAAVPTERRSGRSAQLGEPERDLALGAVRQSRRRAPGSPGWTATGRRGWCRRRPCGRRCCRPCARTTSITWSPESTSATSGPPVMNVLQRRVERLVDVLGVVLVGELAVHRPVSPARRSAGPCARSGR